MSFINTIKGSKYTLQILIDGNETYKLDGGVYVKEDISDYGTIIVDIPFSAGNIKQAIVSTVNIPYMWKVINTSNNEFSVQVNGQPNPTIVTIEPSTYTHFGLMTTLKLLLKENVDANLDVIVDNSSQKFTFVHTTSTNFTLSFGTNASLKKILGFTQNTYVDDFNYTAENSYNLNPDDYICIKCPNLIQGINPTISISRTTQIPNLLAIIPITCDYGQYLSGSMLHILPIDIIKTPISSDSGSQKWTFSLSKIDNTPINLTFPWSMILTLTLI